MAWHTAWARVVAWGQPLVDDPQPLAGVAALEMGDMSWLRTNWHHHTPFVSGPVDTATGRLLDMVPDRTVQNDVRQSEAGD